MEVLKIMIVAVLMMLLLWFITLLLLAVIKADKEIKKDFDLGLFAYLENTRHDGIGNSKRKNKSA